MARDAFRVSAAWGEVYTCVGTRPVLADVGEESASR
jgi:hypothetical protein